MRRILIVGATSAIAEATARLFAANGDALFLTARNQERLAAIAADLRIRGAQAETYALDINRLDEHEPMLNEAVRRIGGLDAALIAHGTLPDQANCQQSVSATLEALQTNALSTIAILTLLANRFEQQGQGVLAVISSVAGDRGRQSNYVYGAAKAAVSTFLQGLRNRLHPAGVQVLTIKPGFVDTPMTAHIESKGPLWAQPQAVAQGIFRAIERRSDTVYLPWFWRWIMLIIRLIPEPLFKRLKL